MIKARLTDLLCFSHWNQYGYRIVSTCHLLECFLIYRSHFPLLSLNYCDVSQFNWTEVNVCQINWFTVGRVDNQKLFFKENVKNDSKHISMSFVAIYLVLIIKVKSLWTSGIFSAPNQLLSFLYPAIKCIQFVATWWSSVTLVKRLECHFLHTIQQLNVKQFFFKYSINLFTFLLTVK